MPPDRTASRVTSLTLTPAARARAGLATAIVSAGEGSERILAGEGRGPGEELSDRVRAMP